MGELWTRLATVAVPDWQPARGRRPDPAMVFARLRDGIAEGPTGAMPTDFWNKISASAVVNSLLVVGQMIYTVSIVDWGMKALSYHSWKEVEVDYPWTESLKSVLPMSSTR